MEAGGNPGCGGPQGQGCGQLPCDRSVFSSYSQENAVSGPRGASARPALTTPRCLPPPFCILSPSEDPSGNTRQPAHAARLHFGKSLRCRVVNQQHGGNVEIVERKGETLGSWFSSPVMSLGGGFLCPPVAPNLCGNTAKSPSLK